MENDADVFLRVRCDEKSRVALGKMRQEKNRKVWRRHVAKSKMRHDE